MALTCPPTQEAWSREEDISSQMDAFRAASKFTNVDIFSGCGTLVGSAHRSVLASLSPVLASYLSVSACECGSSNCQVT
jgi:hypothetical protein